MGINVKSFSKIFLFIIIGILFMMFVEPIEAQGTNIGTFKQMEDNHVVWTVALADFDSADVVWSTGFILESVNTTFDAQGTVNLGTAAAGGTYSTVVLLYASFDDGTSFELVDSLGTITSTTLTKFDIDLDDFDQGPQYKFKVTNGGADNSFKLGAFRE